MIKQYDETYRGWGGENDDGREYGYEGYSLERAKQKVEIISAEMRRTNGIQKVNVFIEPMANGNYCVRNRSTYDSQY